jgi:hypothetical protein
LFLNVEKIGVKFAYLPYQIHANLTTPVLLIPIYVQAGETGRLPRASM